MIYELSPFGPNIFIYPIPLKISMNFVSVTELVLAQPNQFCVRIYIKKATLTANKS